LLRLIDKALDKAQIPLYRLPRDVRDKPVTSPSSNSITLTSPKLLRFGEVGVMEFALKGTSRVCRGLVADVTGKST